MRMSPFVGAGLSLAGADGRSTNFTVDGANFNNNMGLGGGALSGGGTPISLEALEEMQIWVVDFKRLITLFQMQSASFTHYPFFR